MCEAKKVRTKSRSVDLDRTKINWKNRQKRVKTGRDEDKDKAIKCIDRILELGRHSQCSRQKCTYDKRKISTEKYNFQFLKNTIFIFNTEIFILYKIRAKKERGKA